MSRIRRSTKKRHKKKERRKYMITLEQVENESGGGLDIGMLSWAR
jgi:hypothetical protein